MIVSNGLGDTLLDIPAPEGSPYIQRIRVSSLAEASHYLGGGGNRPGSLLFEVVRGNRTIISLPVRSVPVAIRKAHLELANAGKLTLLWSDDFSYLTIVERCDHGRPSFAAVPTAATYWLEPESGPVKVQSESDGADQPAVAPESKSEDGQNPKPKSAVHPR